MGYDDGELPRLSHIALTTVSQEAALEHLDGDRTDPPLAHRRPTARVTLPGTASSPRDVPTRALGSH